MVKATTPLKQMEAFREEGLRVRGRLEARKLVERITTEIKIWETRLSCSKEKLSDTEEMLQRLGESFTERHREEVLRRDMLNVQSAKKNFKAFEKSANAFIYSLEAKYGLESDSGDSDHEDLQTEDDDTESVNQIGRDVSQELSSESLLRQESRESKNNPEPEPIECRPAV